MTWLIIIVILAAAFAPVAYMMPSKRDKALANLRMIARREGLEVDVTRLPNLEAEAHERVSAGGVVRQASTDCVSYGLRLPKSEGSKVYYRLLYSPTTQWPVRTGSHWQLDDAFSAATASHPVVGDPYWDLLTEVDPLLPGDRLGLAITDDFVLFYWRERLAEVATEPAEVVVSIRKTLNKVADHHRRAYPPQRPEIVD